MHTSRTTCRRGRGGGHPPSSVRYLCTACRRGKGGGLPDQEGEVGAPPEQRAILAHGMQEREGGVGLTKREKGGHPPSSSARAWHEASYMRWVGVPQTYRGPPPQDES